MRCKRKLEHSAKHKNAKFSSLCVLVCVFLMCVLYTLRYRLYLADLGGMGDCWIQWTLPFYQ